MGLKDVINKVNEAVERSKKLTTKDRKKLNKGTFCGPSRSFPVPDCKHVGTAKAYLNRSNFSDATKKRIAACINRKAKSLGCTPGKPAKSKGSVEEIRWENLTFIERALADTEIFKSTKELVDKSLENEEALDLDFDECDNENCL